MRKSLRILAAVLTGTCIFASGCGSKKTDTVNVQSVSMLNGVTPEMNLEKFSGIVTSGNVTAVKRQDGRQIANVAVKKGDQVTAGQLLFTYDADSTRNDLERENLELQQLQNTISAKTAEKNQLLADKKKAKADEQLDYTLKIQDADTDLREAQYNLSLKQKEISKTQSLLSDLSVSAPISGTVTHVGSTSSSGSDDQSTADDGADEAETMDEEVGADSMASSDVGGTDDSASSSGSGSSTFIKIEETGVLRVKGNVNEANIGDISKGMPMVVCSRTDDKKMWRGTVTSISTSPASDSSQNDDGDTDTMTQSSKYPFYVKLSDHDGLMIGQHVYLEQDVGQGKEGDQSIRLPADFIVDAKTSTPIVWMEDENGLLTTRGIKLGDYQKSDNSYAVESGLTMDDYIAYPDSSLKKGMKCKEQEGSESEEGAMSGMDSTIAYADSGTDVAFSDAESTISGGVS